MPKNTNYQITTTLAVDGEKEFKAAMDAANKSMRVSDSELKKLKAAYDAGGTQMDYYTGRAKVMNREAEQQEAIVEALRKAVEQAGEKFGEASDKVKDYQIKLNNAEAKQIALAKAAQEANRDLEALGRDSNKIGRQIERGIGDAAEDAGEKLDSMFERVQKDVNALKTSVGFEIATEVGGFIVNAVQGVTGFVEENEELNRQLAITEYNISKYDFDWMTTLGLVSRATAITGNQEGALEAINNLVSTQVTNEELINAALEGILGVFITTGGALSLESLAEDARASVVNKEATGTYAEVLEELIQGVVIDDVNKALKATKSAEEALEIVTAYLTEAGFQTTTKSFEEQNKAYIEAATKRSDLALKWAALAEELTPVVSGLTDGSITLVEGITKIVQHLKKATSKINEYLGDKAKEAIDEAAQSYNFAVELAEMRSAQQEAKSNGKALEGLIYENAEKLLSEELGSLQEIVERTTAENMAIIRKYDITAPGVSEFVDSVIALLEALGMDIAGEWLNELEKETKSKSKTKIPAGDKTGLIASALGGLGLVRSANAETIADPYEAGFKAMQQYNMGLQEAADAEVTAAQAAAATAIAQMQSEANVEAAMEAGRNAMIAFGNGIAEGAAIPINNVQKMVNQINAMLSAMASPTYGLGWGGITGGNIALYMDGQKVGGLVAGGVSSALGRKVSTKMTMK